MAKEKMQNIEIRENERLFHYEILGIILLVISLLAITKIGILGEYLMLIVKLLFGDWYFLIYILIIIYSIRCILVHKRLKINNIRYLGIFLLICSLILLSHFSMHKYVKDYDDNYLLLTIKLYLNSFKTKSANSIIGGGIIGACMFYISYFLLSEVGVILISILFIFLGVVFISKKTIKDFISSIIVFLKKGYSFFINIKKKIKNKVDNFDLSYKKTKVRYKISKINANAFYNQELEFAKRNVELIKKVLNSMNVFYNDISYIICRNITVYFINSYYKFSYEVFSRNISKYIHNYLLKYDDIKKELIVEINNLNPVPLRICELEQTEDEVIFAIDDRNNFIKLNNEDNSLFVYGLNKYFLCDYIDSVVLSLMHLKSNIKYSYIDLYNYSFLQTSNSFDELDSILIDVNDRIKMFNEVKVSTIDEYNKKINKKLKKQLIIITGFEKVLYDKHTFEKILYLIETTKNYGYYFIFTTIETSKEHFSLYNLFSFKIFLDSDNSYYKECLKDINSDILNKDVEGFLLYKSIILRCSLLLLTDFEKNNIR